MEQLLLGKRLRLGKDLEFFSKHLLLLVQQQHLRTARIRNLWKHLLELESQPL